MDTFCRRRGQHRSPALFARWSHLLFNSQPQWVHYRPVAWVALSPGYAQALDIMPGWRDHPTKRDAGAARWKQRLAEVAAYLAAVNEWPRVNKTDDRAERVLGVWLHTQRIDYRAGKLTAAKGARLNEFIPGWRQGRPRRGANSRTAIQRTPSGAEGISGQL